jgi:hypothetical protein
VSSQLAEPITRVPDHIGIGEPACLAATRSSTMAPPRMGASRLQAQAGNDTGDLVRQGHLVDEFAPADVAGLHGQVYLVADVRSGWAIVGG